MQRIKDLQMGATVRLPLAVLDAEIKPARNGPYLYMSLFDGVEAVTANLWSYRDSYVPTRNTVVNIVAKVTSWNDTLQLNVVSVEQNIDIDINVFAPQGDFDISELVSEASALINSIENEAIRSLVRNIFNDNGALIKTVPAAKGIHHAYVAGNLKHSVDTALKARAIGLLTPGCSIDLVIAGGLLHDIGKLQTYVLNGAAIDMTVEGNLLEHIVLGVILLERYRTEENSNIVTLLQHIIAAHHGKLEYGSPVTPRFIEAWVINYADGVDARTETIACLNKVAAESDIFTKKEWSLDNRAMLTQTRVQALLNI